MTNLTLVIDEDILRRARIRALQQGTSVNSLVRDYLAGVAGESEAARGIAAFRSVVEGSAAGSGGRSWQRAELHDR